MSAAITVDGLWKNFRLYHERNRYIKAAVLRGRRARYEEFWALKDISFEIQQQPDFIYINKCGLYSLLIVSKTHKSKKFIKWLTSDVLPSLFR